MKTALLTLAVSILLTPLYAQEKMTLEACMKYAIEHSTSVQQQEIALEDARQNYIGAVASAMPSINASTGGTMNYGRSIDPATNTYTTTSTFNNSYSLSGSLTVFNGLSTINTIKATKVMRAMGIEELQLARDQIAMNTMSAYFDVVYYYGTVEIAQEQLRTSQLELKQVQEQYELDLKAPADVAEVEAQVANYDYLLTEQQSNLELALIELRKVMNYPQEEPLEIDTEVDIEGMLITETLEEVLNYALVYNPQIRSKEMNSRYYELNYASTKGRYLPSISLSGGFSTNYFVNVDSPGNYAKYFNQLGNNRGYYVGMSMSIPIFSGLSRRVAKHRAKLQYDNAILAHTEQRRTLESEVAKTYQEMQNFGKQYIMSQKKVQANDLAYRSVSQKFAEGMVTAIDLQTASNNLLQARSDLLHARLQYIIKCRMVGYYNGIPLIR
jgi:outer membrane protein